MCETAKRSDGELKYNKTKTNVGMTVQCDPVRGLLVEREQQITDIVVQESCKNSSRIPGVPVILTKLLLNTSLKCRATPLIAAAVSMRNADLQTSL
jgi:hypothetical protein